MSESVLAPLPGLAANHLLLAAAALALGLLVAAPLAFVSLDRPRLRALALGFASLVQTIPGLALLALFYPLLLAISTLVGGGIPALGFLPALLALALYALLPILRNLVTGLTGIDPALIEAANGLGMTRWQRLRLVEAPLAAPVAMAGIRTAAVWTIGAATLATTVGAPSLGNLIFSGLQLETWSLVLAGCLAAAGLALAVDALLALVERGIGQRRGWLIAVPGLILAAALGAAIWLTLAPGRRPVTVGAKNFSEQYILAQLIGGRLERAHYPVLYREGLGSLVVLSALEGGQIDAYVEYSGTIWADAMGRTDSPPAREMDEGIARWLRDRSGAGVVGSLGFENAYALAMRRERAQALGIRTIADLSRAAPNLTLGADLEFQSRPEWRALREAYGLRFSNSRAFAPTFMYRALMSGQADVISAFSSDGRIAADDLVVLADSKHAVPAYDALLLVSPQRAHDRRFLATLQPLVGSITPARMRQANYLIDRDQGKATPDAAARWLAGG